MKIKVISIVLLAFLGLGFKSDKPAYKIYNEKGKKVSYSNMLEKLSDNAKEFIAPLPINYDPELACYKNMLKMGGPMGKEANPNFPKAQAVKDATMVFFILNNWQEGKLLFHFNGSYHSDNFQGIVWHVKQQKPDLKIITITTKLQGKIDKLDDEYLNAANFILVVPESMTTTY